MNSQPKKERSDQRVSPLPESWREERLYDIADLRTSNVDKKSEEGEISIRLCNYTDVYYRRRITNELDFMEATATISQVKRFGLLPGDVVITKDSETPDDIGVPSIISELIPDLVCGYHLTIIRPLADAAVGDYLLYALISQLSAYQFYLASNGVTRFGLTYQGMKNIRVALPPLDKQRQIAAFLDWKTGQIDALITKKRELVERLKEKRISVIIRAATKGMDPSAPMRDSCIDWLDRVPRHWNIIPLGFLMTMSGGMTPSTSNAEYWEGDIPWVTPKDMKQERISDSIDHITEKALEETGLAIIPVGAVLVVVRGMILAHSFPVAITEGPVTVNQDMKALRCEGDLDARFLFWCLTGFSKVLSGLAQESAHGTLKVESDTLKKFAFPVPPIDEQREIVRFLESRLNHLDRLVEATENTIANLSEYRSALITAATSGQIDVHAMVKPVA
jgi:type I restriction enzyme S subunit